MAQDITREPNRGTVLVDISADDDLSSAIPGTGFAFGSISFPAMTSTTVTFSKSIDGGTTYRSAVEDDGSTAISMTVDATGISAYLPAKLFPFDALKIVCGSSEGADRTIQYLLHG